MAKLLMTFSLDTEKDKRLARWLDGLPKRERSKAIRDALAAHLGQNGITLADIYEAVQDLKRYGVAIASQDGGKQDDDPALTEALENLSKLGL